MEIDKLAELAVMPFLTANKHTFVVPQYSIGDGWSCPDYVALRPTTKECFIVEVTTSSNPTGLVEKIINRETHWLAELRKFLFDAKLCDLSWKFRVLAFVREDQLEWVNNKIGHTDEVATFPLELVIFPWRWPDEVWNADYAFLHLRE